MANLSIVKTNEGRTIFSPTGRPLFALVTIKEHTFTSSERHFVRCYDGAVLAHFQGGEVTINGIKSKADQLFHARSTLGKLFRCVAAFHLDFCTQ